MALARTQAPGPIRVNNEILSTYSQSLTRDPLPVQWLADSLLLGAQQAFSNYDSDVDLAGGPRLTIPTTRSSNTILAAGDSGKIFSCTAQFTQTLTAAATLGAGWWCVIRNDTATGSGIVVTIDPNSAETIDGAATLAVAAASARVVVCNGTLFISGDYLV